MTKRTLIVGLALAAPALAAPVWAYAPTELQILDCATGDVNEVCNRPGQNTGPGIEQTTHALMNGPNGGKYLVAIYMTSKVPVANRPYQCACTSMLLDPVRGPTIVADKVQLTTNQGNRPCNHPALASNGDFGVYLYGTNDPNQTNVATYAQAVDAMCNILTPQRVKVSNDDNNNSAAPSIVSMGLHRTTFAGGYYVNGANQTHAIVLEATKNAAGQVDINETHDTVVVDPTNIGRPTSLRIADNKHMICASQGNQRPPEDGIRCALVDTDTGNPVWSQLIIQADNNSNPVKRYNTPNLALVGDKVFVQFEQTNARGRDGNNNRQRGQTMTHVMAFSVDPNANTVTPLDHQMNIGLNQVHGTICAGNFGTAPGAAGAVPGTGIGPMAAIVDSSITGSGVTAAQMIKFDTTKNQIGIVGKQLAVGTQIGDGGYLSNIYGQNPNDQGREFLSCLGDVPNTGYHQPNGFRPDVKSFFVFTYGGLIAPGKKNSGFTAFYPAEVDTPVPPMQFPLSLAVSGNGQGRITSSPIGINCTSATCSAQWDQNVVVTLTAVPAAGSKFDGWTGDCNGSAQCVVRIDQARNVTASFSMIDATVPPVPVFVAFDGDGHGTIGSNPAALNCNAACNGNFEENSMVTISATPDATSKFMGWSGDCTGIGDCVLTADAEKHIVARFIHVDSGGGVSSQLPRGPDPRPGNGVGNMNNPGSGTKTIGHDTSACAIVGNNSGALTPMLLVLVLVGLIRRRNAK